MGEAAHQLEHPHPPDGGVEHVPDPDLTERTLAVVATDAIVWQPIPGDSREERLTPENSVEVLRRLAGNEDPTIMDFFEAMNGMTFDEYDRLGRGTLRPELMLLMELSEQLPWFEVDLETDDSEVFLRIDGKELAN